MVTLRQPRVLSIPHDHDFVRAAVPAGSLLRPAMSELQARGWEVSPAFSVGWLEAHRAEIGAVHVHFGFEGVPVGRLRAWTAALAAMGIPLVVTVHDLRNPHGETPGEYDEQLRVLVAAAAEVVTLTPGAAAEIARRFGRTAGVVAHPPLLESPRPEATQVAPRRAAVGITLKPRAQVREPDRLVMAALRGVEDSAVPGAGLVVRAHPSLLGSMPNAGAAAGDGRLELCELRRLDDADFPAYLAGLAVCVLPYRFGTHSGWLEACRDVGTRVVAPDCGYFAEQWPEVHTYGNNERSGLDDDSLAAAVSAALAAPAPAAGEAATARTLASRRAYAAVYDQVAAA